MNRSLKTFCDSEYRRFRECLQEEWGVSTASISSAEANIKHMHKIYLALACAATVCGSRTRGKEYASGIVENASLSIVMGVKGRQEVAYVLIRQTIELALKFVYFNSHPIEYEWVKNRDDYRITFQFLRDYICKLDTIRPLNKGNRIADALDEWYGLLSRYVHTHNKRFIGYATQYHRRSNQLPLIPELTNRAKQTWTPVVEILVFNAIEKFGRASMNEQNLIRSLMSRQAKLTLKT